MATGYLPSLCTRMCILCSVCSEVYCSVVPEPRPNAISPLLICYIHLNTVCVALYKQSMMLFVQCSVAPEPRPNAISPLLIAPGSTWFSPSRGPRPSDQSIIWSDTGVSVDINYLGIYSVKVISTEIYMFECPLDKAGDPGPPNSLISRSSDLSQPPVQNSNPFDDRLIKGQLRTEGTSWFKETVSKSLECFLVPIFINRRHWSCVRDAHFFSVIKSRFSLTLYSVQLHPPCTPFLYIHVQMYRCIHRYYWQRYMDG